MMLADKRINPATNSKHRISLPKTLPAIKQSSNRSISLIHNNQFLKKEK
jgi:hypothetical protein